MRRRTQTALVGVLLWAAVQPARGDDAAALKQLEAGVALYQQGKHDQAREAFFHARELAPERPNPYRWLGLTDAKLGRCSDAVLELETFIRIVPPNDKRVAEVAQARDQCQSALAAVKPPQKGGQVVPATFASSTRVAFGEKSAAGDQPLTVAVAEFRAEGLTPELTWLGKSFADALIARLSHARTVRVVEREFLDKILGELKLQSSAMVDEQSAVQVGRLLGARVFVFGSVSILGDQMVVRARTVSVERAEVLDTAEAGGGTKTVFAVQKDFAQKVAGAMALEAAMATDASLEINEVAISAMSNLERIRLLARDLPWFGLDPARARKKGEYIQALGLCDQVLATYPSLAMAHYYRALFSLHSDDADRAIAEIGLARKLRLDDVELALLKGNVLYAARDQAGAQAAFADATRRFADDARGWYALGRLQVEKRDRVEAVAAFLASLERQPLTRDAESNLQTLLGGPDGAGLLAEIKSRRPQLYPAAAVFRAYYTHDLKGAEAVAAQATGLSPNLYMGYFVRGVLAREKGRITEAVPLLEKVLALRPSFADVHRELGLLYLASGSCALGKTHIDLYMKSATMVDDYPLLDKRIKSCRPD